VLLTTALAALAAVALVRPAAAHDYLVGSVPEQGATVDSVPSEVTLEFNTSIGERFAQVAVVDDTEGTYQVGEPVVDGATLTQAVDGLQPGMTVTVSYRVVSSDGHPIGGTVPFSIAAGTGGEAPPPTPEGTDTTTTDSTDSTDAAGATTDSTTDSTTGTAATSTTDSSTVSPVVWVAAVAVAALLAGSALALSRRRSRTSTSP